MQVRINNIFTRQSNDLIGKLWLHHGQRINLLSLLARVDFPQREKIGLMAISRMLLFLRESRKPGDILPAIPTQYGVDLETYLEEISGSP